MFKNNFIYQTIRLFSYKYLEFKISKNKLKVQMQWRDKNRHNFTSVKNSINDSVFPIDKVKVGRGTYGSLCVISYGSSDEHLEIGEFCSIASGVKFLLGGEHNLNKFSTFPFKRIYLNNGEIETFSKGHIILEDGCLDWNRYFNIIRC
jgi:acetyltransferase-like isoleucine patch superfamily enzyme